MGGGMIGKRGIRCMDGIHSYIGEKEKGGRLALSRERMMYGMLR